MRELLAGPGARALRRSHSRRQSRRSSLGPPQRPRPVVPRSLAGLAEDDVGVVAAAAPLLLRRPSGMRAHAVAVDGLVGPSWHRRLLTCGQADQAAVALELRPDGMLTAR